MASQPDAGAVAGGQPEDIRLPGPGRYRKRPVEVDAIQWTGGNVDEIFQFTGREYFDVLDAQDRANSDDPEATATVFDKLHSTWVLVKDGQWIIRGVKGELYPCAADVFAATYEPASTPAADPMWERAYMDVQAVLDRALGTQEEDGAGAGIAADVALLAYQRDEAIAEAARLKEMAERGVMVHVVGGSSRRMGRDWARLVPGLQGRLVSFGGVNSAFAWIDTRPEQVPEQEAAGQLTFPGDPAAKSCGCGPGHRCVDCATDAELLAAIPPFPIGRREAHIVSDAAKLIESTLVGISLITAERLRQVAVEGYDEEHDAEHADGDLIRAAVAYATDAAGATEEHTTAWWPWARAGFKPGPKPLDSLVKAGALIAAEIDRIVGEEARRG